MPKQSKGTSSTSARDALIAGLNEDLSREYQPIIAYVVYSQVLKGAAYMSIAKELETHAAHELQHALVIAKQIDYLGGAPNVQPRPVTTSDDAKAMRRFDLAQPEHGVSGVRRRRPAPAPAA
jgi:bacterioferritin